MNTNRALTLTASQSAALTAVILNPGQHALRIAYAMRETSSHANAALADLIDLGLVVRKSYEADAKPSTYRVA